MGRKGKGKGKGKQKRQPGQRPLIAIGLSFFEDVDSLDKCLSSVLDNRRGLGPYCKVLAIDGKYKGYPIDHPLSKDGSRELVQEYSNRYPGQVELFDYPNLLERFKRQKYVDIGSQQGIPFLFILDSDEYIECKNVYDFLAELRMIQDVWTDRNKVIQDNINNDRIPIIPHAVTVYHIKCVELDNLGYVFHAKPVPRLWFNYHNMRYTSHSFFSVTRQESEKHTKLLDATQQQYTPLFVLQNMQIWHSHQERNEDRERRRMFYEQERLPNLEDRCKTTATTTTTTTR